MPMQGCTFTTPVLALQCPETKSSQTSVKYMRFVGIHNSTTHTKYYSWVSTHLSYKMVGINVQPGIPVYKNGTMYDSGKLGAFNFHLIVIMPNLVQ